MDIESEENEAVKDLQNKLKTLRQQKEKLSGSKNKRERAKVNKQISAAQRKLETLRKAEERQQSVEANKKLAEQQKLEKKKIAEKQERDDKDYIKECEAKHNLKDATLAEISERIEARKTHFAEFHHAEYWNLLIGEQETSMKEEQIKQSKFLKVHGLTQADMDATLEKIRERRAEKAKEKAAEAEAEAETKTEQVETEGDEVGVQTEEVVFLEENAEDIPKPFPGYKPNESSDSDAPEQAGPSEGPEETGSEKPLEPAVIKDEEPPEVEAEEENVEAREEDPDEDNTPDGADRKDYGSSQYWDDRYEKFADKTEEWYEGWKTLQNIIAPFISKDMMIMDFGCGDSFMQDELAKEGFTCFGTDISNVVLQRLAEDPKREMFSADGFAMPLRSSCFDVIIDKGTLDAIGCDENRDLKPLFEELYRILAPGGQYLCITPWHAEKRLHQLSLVPWEISHEVMPMSLPTLTKQRFNQLKNHPKLGKDRKLLMMMSTRQAKSELAALNIEEAKNLPPERSCVLHCYVCQKGSS